MSLDKTFNHLQDEPEIYTSWLDTISKNADVDPEDKAFTIILPPPNITGFLHVGHAFTSTLQDTLLRVNRQNGCKTLGQPGVDHAGIATQIVVDRQLAAQGISRLDIGREAFIDKVWEWKAQSGGQIFNQLKRLGMTADWNRLRFTMDEASSRAVLRAFVQFYKDGMIYRAQKLVNWDPILKTAVSDLEVANKDTAGSLWYIRYKAVDRDDHIVVATTRPETLFGDMAVAVHPEDERYRHWIGQKVRLPLTQRTIPVIADLHSDPSKGTGAVKITPAHDFNDFEVGKRHHLPSLTIMDESARLNDEVPESFRGLTCEEARVQVLEALSAQDLLEKTEPITHSIPYNDRSGAVIEPRLTNQWFLDAQKLAGPAIEAVETGRVRFIPDQWKNTYFEWMRNIQPWCISRQIWWGHQIPVWYAPDGEFFCAETEEEAREQAAAHFNVPLSELPELTRDPDVLDTWFSSALWPFSTQGWPDVQVPKRYPTDVLVTAFDIIFFWVARMIMVGLYFMHDVPFRHVYIHPLVRDAKGQKMSKSKGNVIDPLLLMDKYGTDAVRFTLVSLAIPGRDIRLSEPLIENNRNFMTKIWNAARFLEMNACTYNGAPAQPLQLPLNVWISEQLNAFKVKTQEDVENYRFDFVAQNIQKFLRDTFCDIYIECLKPCLQHASDTIKAETRTTAAWVFGEFLNVAHSVIPFITEHLWHNMAPQEEPLITRAWFSKKQEFSDTTETTAWYINLMQEIRSLRGLLGIAPGEKLKLIVPLHANDHSFLKQNQYWLCPIARLLPVEFAEDMPTMQGLHFVFRNQEFCLLYPDGIEREDVQAILSKKSEQIQNDLQKLVQKIQNAAYKAAKPDQWEADHDLFEQKNAEFGKIQELIKQF